MISEETTKDGAGSAIVIDDTVVTGAVAVAGEDVVNAGDPANTDEISIIQLECKRCYWTWYPRKPVRPRVCPKCKSPYWDRDYEKVISSDRKARRWDSKE